MEARTEKRNKAVISQFQMEGEPEHISPYGNGHINDTYLVAMKGNGPDYILQRINKSVFPQPEVVVENIAGVTAYLRDRIEKRGGDVTREVLNLIPTLGGENFLVDSDGQYWRAYLFVDRTITYQLPDTEAVFRESARAFARFGALLAEYPSEKLNHTIPGFHDTPWRYQQLRQAIQNDPRRRAKEVERELAFAFARETEASRLQDMQNNGQLPVRVTHNDTKLNNVLFDAQSNTGVCVIDLDTVMPGLAAHDFGDAIRFGANTSEEDEADLSKCELSLPMFRAYTEGYLEIARGTFTDHEIAVLPVGAKMMTLECGIRFLADYINGDVYFKVHDPDQNLRRARNQLKLVQSMEDKWVDMNAIVENAL